MRLLADRRKADPIEAVVGTLAYISSEQALRINRPVTSSPGGTGAAATGHAKPDLNGSKR